jgi:glycosyltransferase involved in cell wall biosynthesis
LGQKKKILILYSELADYVLACIRALASSPNVEVLVVHWPVNSQAPFKFDFPSEATFLSREGIGAKELVQLAQEFSPDLILCSGWMDKGYLKLCKNFRQKIPVVVGFDNHWKGTLKQKIAVAISPFTIHRHFSHAFVPGVPQVEYARKLGFRGDKIITGYYSADYDKFSGFYRTYLERKSEQIPKRFIFAGRYVEHKGIKDLWKVFIDIQQESPNEWELWCLGVGPLQKDATEHPKIKHFGFVQPSEMESFIAKSSVLILPSYFEPWGVVVHEFAAAGFPLVCSSDVGAASQFIHDGINGYIFQHDSSGLKEAILKIIHAPSEALVEMGRRSNQLAGYVTPKIWAENLLAIK